MKHKSQKRLMTFEFEEEGEFLLIMKRYCNMDETIYELHSIDRKSPEFANELELWILEAHFSGFEIKWI